jgi:hypothetical protein
MRERVAVSEGVSLPQHVRDVMIMPPAKKYIFKKCNQQGKDIFFAPIYYTF